MTTKAAIIIRTLGGRPDMLREAVASVEQQDYPTFYVVVEGVRPRERALNVGIERALEAGADYVGFLDDDDVLYKGHVSKLVRALEATLGAGVAYSDSKHVWCDERNQPVKDGAVLEGPFDHDQLCVQNCRPNHSFLIRRQLLEFEKCDETLGLEFCADDWDLWMRLSLRTSFVHAPGVTSEYRVRKDGDNATFVLRDEVHASVAATRIRFAKYKRKQEEVKVDLPEHARCSSCGTIFKPTLDLVIVGAEKVVGKYEDGAPAFGREIRYLCSDRCHKAALVTS